MHSERSKLIDSYIYSVLPNGKFPCINYMYRSVLSPKTVHYFKLHCRHHSHVMWTTSCKLWTPFWILLFDYKKCSWASGPGTTPHVQINYPGWSIHLSQWLGQDNPAASRVNLFTWNSSYQVRCAELTDALPHRWTRHQAPWCLDAFPIALSRRPPIPAVAPPSMPASTSRTFQPSMPAMSWSTRIPPSAELATADAVVKHGSPTQRCRTALKFSEAWQLLAALRSWPWSLGLAVASNIENKPTSVKKTSLHYDFSVLGSDFSWRL